MNYKWLIKAGMLLVIGSSVRAQENAEYQFLHFTSSHTSFPDTGRVNGHVHDSILYTKAGHYDDSSVLLCIPKQLKANEKIDLVFWFHGWHNNIDTAIGFYALARQFIASRRNAILVLPEAAKNSADSYGGKLQQKGIFKDLVQDVMDELKKKNKVPGNSVPGHIVLAGHSGAFQVIADILKNGQTPVDEVFLFDALYSRVDVFTDWIGQSKEHHFIHWFTNHGGGTDEMSDTMMIRLKSRHLDYQLVEEKNTTPEIIKNNRILFVHSLREHNVIINNPDDFQLLLEHSFCLEKR
ncbi:MAG TPA: hypothetical protein VK563_12205 [Puia sp.]|nr:hypothetical protein [Puia sp.]